MSTNDPYNIEIKPAEDIPSTLPVMLSYPGLIYNQPKRQIIELVKNKDEADPLPPPVTFTEGTCEC